MRGAQQLTARADRRDRLQVLERLAHEVARLGVVREFAAVAAADEHRVEHHRRHPRERRLRHDAADRRERRRDDGRHRACRRQRAAHLVDQRLTHARRRDQRDLARADRRLRAADEAQRRREARDGRRRRRLRRRQAEPLGHFRGKPRVESRDDLVHDTRANLRLRHLAELEAIRIADVPLLDVGHALVEQRGLREMVGERFAAHAHLGAFERLGHRLEAAAGRRRRRLARPAAVQRIRLVRRLTDRDGLPVHRVALIVRERAQRPVDRQLVKIRPPSRLSCVSVYENSRPAAAGRW
jgi:hypothetical protein